MSQLEDLRAKKAARDDAAKSARDQRELETLLLEEKLEAELGGVRGRAFQIVDVVGEPLIVVKPGPAVVFKQLRESKASLDDLQRFVAACLHTPDVKGFADIVERRAGVVVRCADAAIALYRGEAEDEGKKY